MPPPLAPFARSPPRAEPVRWEIPDSPPTMKLFCRLTNGLIDNVVLLIY